MLAGADWWNLTEEKRVPDPSLPGHPIVFANPAFLKLTGYARPEVLGRSAALFQGPLTSRSSLIQIREVVRAERTAQLVLLNYRKDGSPFWIILRISPVFSPRSATVVHFLAVQVPLLRHRASSPVRDLLTALRMQKLCFSIDSTPICSGRAACDATGHFGHVTDVEHFVKKLNSLLRFSFQELEKESLIFNLDTRLSAIYFNVSLINGCVIEEFIMEIGLRQGEPIAPFLFLIVADGLVGMVANAQRLRLLSEVHVGDHRL
ncbi:hypothetical protein Fmac_000941 [Flemingia macrophylla]|uniref:PAS domain-containing protein n=1 Tax=Flemingia macrophylla TaxID=520843 RepID=A0ABD1NFT7_9FABA